VDGDAALMATTKLKQVVDLDDDDVAKLAHVFTEKNVPPGDDDDVRDAIHAIVLMVILDTLLTVEGAVSMEQWQEAEWEPYPTVSSALPSPGLGQTLFNVVSAIATILLTFVGAYVLLLWGYNHL
jgi:hypothetical protein